MNADNLKRVPIVMNQHTIVLLHVFTKKDKFEDLWMHDEETVMNANYESHGNAAQQFVSQLEEHWTELFMQNMVKECFKHCIEYVPKRGEELIAELQKMLDERIAQ